VHVQSRFSVVRVSGELLIIAAGILIALGADAWWEDRAEANLEQAYLTAFKIDLEQTIQFNKDALADQAAIQQLMLELSASIANGEALPDTLLRIFPPVTVLRESMDTYRDLVASGGTTRISSLEVRRAMSRVLQEVEFNQLAEEWALDLVTAMRASLLVVPRPVEEERLGEIWSVYVDAGVRLLRVKGQLALAADSAHVILSTEIEGS
jgi:hypothetical protein